MELRMSSDRIAYLYLALPVIIFMFTWIRPLIGISAALLVGFALFLAVRKAAASPISFSRRTIFITIVVAFVWCFFAGQGGFWYQSGDHAWRNAVYRDLVYHPWPVVFEQQNVLLNYYVGYWLVPALFGKALFFMTQNAGAAWLTAKIALLLWSTLSITLCFLLLANVLRCNSPKRYFAAIIVFIFFSGLDILGVYILNKRAGLHLEWWCPGCQYSSFTTCLFWVFNQAVPAWIAILLLLYDRRIENFAFCGLAILVSSPIPLIGLFPIYLAIGLEELIKSKEKLAIVKKVFSLQNIIACLIIFPICFIYFSENAAVSKRGVIIPKPVVVVQTAPAHASTTVLLNAPNKPAPKLDSQAAKMIKRGVKLALFFVFEAGIYLLMLLRKKRKTILYWCIVIELMIIPFIHIGMANDFCMRASIPPLVVLMTMVFDDFYDSYEKKSFKFTVYCIILAFAILTPGKEFYRGVFEIYKHKKFEDNRIISIEKTISKNRSWNNFISYDYSESLFYKYLAKK